MNVKATYTLAEVARMLGRPRQTIQRWAARGSLTTVRLNVDGPPLVPLAALQVHGLVWESIRLAASLNGRRLAG